MGRAIVREPAAFLFDEPLSNLDAKLRVQMRLEIQKLHRELRTTSVFVTHDQVEAMTLADRMIVMNAGTVEQIGRADRGLRRSGHALRRGLHRLARDELPARQAHAATTVDVGDGRARRRCPRSCARRRARRSPSASAPSISMGDRARPRFRFKVETVEALGADSLAARRCSAPAIWSRASTAT